MIMMIMVMTIVVGLNSVQICVDVVMIVMANTTVICHVAASATITASTYIAHDTAASKTAYGWRSTIAAQ
jgi:hypothetical protein